MSNLEQLTSQALVDIAASEDLAALDTVRVRLLGKKGALTEQLKALGTLPASDRRAAGALINASKERVHAALEARRVALETAAIDARLTAERIDVTLPGRGEQRGGLHPVTQITAAHRVTVPARRFRCGHWSGDRRRLP